MKIDQKLKRAASITLLIGLFGCTSKDSSSTVIPDTAALDSSDIPEHLGELENLTVLDPTQPPQFEISFTPEESYGKVNTTAYMISGTNDDNAVSVDHEGRVYLIDRLGYSIHVYTPDGELLFKIGREGRGPGEFLNISTIRLHGDRLMAYDHTLKRIQWFNLDSHELEQVLPLSTDALSIDSGPSGNISSVIPLKNDRMLIGGILPSEGNRVYVGYYIMNERGNLISDELFQLAIQESHGFGGGGMRIPSSDQGILAVSPEGKIYHANTSEFLIHATNTEINSDYSIYYPYEYAPLDREKVLEGFGDFLGPRMRDADFGDHWPALHSMIADDENRLWVSAITEDPDTYTWWVLNDSGELLGKFEWPRSQEIVTIRNGSIYVREKDLENGVLTVQRHEFQMGLI